MGDDTDCDQPAEENPADSEELCSGSPLTDGNQLEGGCVQEQVVLPPRREARIAL